jgi:hypothetical protein
MRLAVCRNARVASICLTARLAQFAQTIEIAADERFLFWPRPTLQLCLAPAGFRKTRTDFDSEERECWIKRGCSAGLARDMILKTLLQINRHPDIENAGSEAQKIDDRHAPRQARGHSPRFGH